MTGLSIIEAMDDPLLFEPWFEGPTWNGWRTILKAAYALPMSSEERAFFCSVAERDPPEQQVKELYVIGGRRAGKDSIASVIAAHAAALFVDGGQLRPGERPMVMCLACDRDQARIVKNYIASYFNQIPMLNAMIERETAQGFELSNRIERRGQHQQLPRRSRSSDPVCDLRRGRVLARRGIREAGHRDLQRGQARAGHHARLHDRRRQQPLSQVGSAPQEVQGRLRQAWR